MKPILLFFCLTISASAFAQVKIDAGFVLMNGQFEYGTQNAKWWALVPDAFAVKEISNGKVCKMVSHQITFLIKGNLSWQLMRLHSNSCQQSCCLTTKFLLTK